MDPCSDAILDLRPAGDFERAHTGHAASVPLEELAGRMHELPAKGSLLDVFDADLERAQAATQLLTGRGYRVRIVRLANDQLTQTGPARVRLWQPSAFLVETLEVIHHVRGGRRGSALDLACGASREAVYLALAGWDVEAIDVLPDALAKAGDLAGRMGVRVQLTRHDLVRTGPPTWGPWDLVCVFRFLRRPLLSQIAAMVRPGGFVVYETFGPADAPAGRAHMKPGRRMRQDDVTTLLEGCEPLVVRMDAASLGRRMTQVLARRNV